MKYGMNLLLWTGHVTEEHFKIMKDIKDAGFDGVEIPVFDTTVDHYKRVRKELDNQIRATPVILITGDQGEQLRLQANEAGATAFLYKPVTSSKLRELVDAYLPVEKDPAKDAQNAARSAAKKVAKP